MAITAPGQVFIADSVEVSAKILKVDSPNRIVVVKGPLGEEVAIMAGDEVTTSRL